MNFITELLRYVYIRRKFFLIPALIILIIIGILFVVAEGTSVAPLIYTLF